MIRTAEDIDPLSDAELARLDPGVRYDLVYLTPNGRTKSLNVLGECIEGLLEEKEGEVVSIKKK